MREVLLFLALEEALAASAVRLPRELRVDSVKEEKLLPFSEACRRCEVSSEFSCWSSAMVAALDVGLGSNRSWAVGLRRCSANLNVGGEVSDFCGGCCVDLFTGCEEGKERQPTKVVLVFFGEKTADGKEAGCMDW